jgi:hypothetical protein
MMEYGVEASIGLPACGRDRFGTTHSKEPMMTRHAAWRGAVMAVGLLLPAAAHAQVQTLKAWHVADVEEMKSKFVALANAIPEDRYDWRPMDGVRSVREVLLLIAAEGNTYPANWGLPLAEGAERGYEAEMARLDGVAKTKAQLVAEMERSFDHLARSLAGMSDSAHAADGKTWGRAMTVEAGITMALADMHEHLGQLIAYARMNRVVPPWSR